MTTHPPLSLRYLKSITDDTGILQHGVFSIPNRRLGYTTDDNARALLVAVRGYELTHSADALELARKYLSFVHHAQNPQYRFSNIMTYQRTFLDADGTEDCLGRCMWGCGVAASARIPESMSTVAKKIIRAAAPHVGDLTSPRAIAYSLIGLCEYLRVEHDEGIQNQVRALADRLAFQVREYSDDRWHWFEPYMTYGNAVLPLSMLMAGSATDDKGYLDVGRRTLDFLIETTVVGGRLEIIGNDGWYQKGGDRPWYDQQSIDAGYSVHALTAAYSILDAPEYLDSARTSYDWFFGKNRSGRSVYDPETGGCRDGINPSGVNENQGAEACVSLLLAQLAMARHTVGQRETQSDKKDGLNE